MHLHILGISGTFMSALALLARAAGHKVTGNDANCYPPVSDMLQANGIPWIDGYEDATQALKADCVIIGNVITRGMPTLEAVINKGKNYTSGPQWLAENILPAYRVLAIAGTHGKTTTTSMLAFILSQAGLNPGFLIGGIPSNFNVSAKLGSGNWFVIEADEYDSAYFDKRPKLMHYRPNVTVITNLEFDHADIYTNLDAIQQQFHYYLKMIPSNGVVIKPRDDSALNAVISRGVFSNLEEIALDGNAIWRAQLLDDIGSSFLVFHHDKQVAEVNWSLIGRFNVENALAAIAASTHAGVDLQEAGAILTNFKSVKRRLEIKADDYGITVYDDFAHHPTAIAKTIQALRQTRRHKRILVVLKFSSFTMRIGVHAESMTRALTQVDTAFVLSPEQFDLAGLAKHWTCPYKILPSTHAIIDNLITQVKPGDAILVMSNCNFDNIHEQLIHRIHKHFDTQSFVNKTVDFQVS
jgi:UDP-N-acetylmuramate: L-alanyl-gamma-D-glutamyl-meso-diaminopimelate ligase